MPIIMPALSILARIMELVLTGPIPTTAAVLMVLRVSGHLVIVKQLLGFVVFGMSIRTSFVTLFHSGLTNSSCVWIF